MVLMETTWTGHPAALRSVLQLIHRARVLGRVRAREALRAVPALDVRASRPRKRRVRHAQHLPGRAAPPWTRRRRVRHRIRPRVDACEGEGRAPRRRVRRSELRCARGRYALRPAPVVASGRERQAARGRRRRAGVDGGRGVVVLAPGWMRDVVLSSSGESRHGVDGGTFRCAV
ncbi:hypothetical protein FKP32DRAFT_683167 [Trametes sanguinea]|nr:hypothetical protein FKP32DRAFT_683167 [Trametes sanguinea]